MADERTDGAAASQGEARPVTTGRPAERHDGGRDAVRDAMNRQLAQDFRVMSQTERLSDTRMVGGAKMIAALDATIDARYGHASPEAVRMKQAAREAVAKSLERGQELRAPQVRSVSRERDAAAEIHRRGEQSMREDGRER